MTHVAKSGRVIVELASPVRDGTVLHDRRGTRLARVMETIGPVARPFASASPLTNNISPHVGNGLFTADEEGGARGPAARQADRRAARGERKPHTSARRPDRRAARGTEGRGTRSAERREGGARGTRPSPRRQGAPRRARQGERRR